MQEIESMSQMKGYKNLGQSQENDILIYKEASASGNAYANYKLGVIMYYGIGVPEDKEKGFALIEKAAETLVTIHVADIGATGRSAENSSGYFYW